MTLHLAWLIPYATVPPVVRQGDNHRDSEERFRNVFEHGGSGIVLGSPDGIVAANPQFCELLGFSQDELIGMDPVEFTHPEDVEETLRMGARLEDRGIPIRRLEKRYVAKSGEIVWCRVSSSAILDESGSVRYGIAMIDDISETKEAQERLRAEKEFSQSVIQSSVDGILTYDGDLEYTLWNPAMERISGKHAKDCIGRYAPEVFPFLSKIGEEELMRMALEGRGSTSVDQRYEIPDTGREGFFEAAYSPIFGSDDDVVGGLGIVRDVTERKAAEETIRESETRFRTLAEATFEGIAIVEEGVILDCNDHLAEVLGYDRDELIGAKVDDLVASTSLELLLKTREEEEYEVAHEYLIVRKDGTQSPVEVRGRSIPYQGRTVLVAAVRDLRDRYRREHAIRQASERLRALALRLQAVREEECASIARELHDDLGQAMTGLRIDLTLLASKLPDAQQELHDRITKMMRATDEHLTLIQSISSRLRPPVLDAMGLPDALLWLVDDLRDRTGLDIDAELPDGEEIRLDPAVETGVFRIAQESVTNVIRHAEASRIELVLRNSDGMLDLVVRDDGIGIRSEDVEAIRSLGLVGMFERALAMGGNLEIGPDPRGGTRVSLTVPLTARRPPKAVERSF